MALWLIPLDHALPAVQAYLKVQGSKHGDAPEAQAVAELLERCVRTSEALLAFAAYVGGRPSPQ